MNDIRRYGPIDTAVREAAVKQGLDLITQGWKRTAAAKVIAPKIGVHWNTVSSWLRCAQENAPGTSVPELQEQVRRLRQELDAANGLVVELAASRRSTVHRRLP
ncbi:hypothetical protein ACWELJ_32645 [Nocardia sp. NPDC004582]